MNNDEAWDWFMALQRAINDLYRKGDWEGEEFMRNWRASITFEVGR